MYLLATTEQDMSAQEELFKKVKKTDLFKRSVFLCNGAMYIYVKIKIIAKNLINNYMEQMQII